MSNVKKGNQFEEKSLKIIENLKENGLFGIKDFIEITPKAKRYSELRKAEIEFDLIIEFKPPNADRPMMTYFIECKNYGKRVPVEQVQKFHSDILQVSGVNAKGIIISRGAFQKSAYNFAESTGMMVIEGESVNNFNIIHYKRSSENESKIPFIEKSLIQNLLDEGLKSIEKVIDRELLKILVETKNNQTYGIDKLSKEGIYEISKVELNKINSGLLRNAYGLNAKELKEYLNREYGIQIQYFEPKEHNYLGTCNIDTKIIGISKRIVNTSREMFVLGHEFGHFLLHQKVVINQKLLNSFNDSKFSFSKGKHNLENPRQWIEWQANYFSISLLLPQSSITAKLWQSMQRRGLEKGNFVLNDSFDSHKKFQSIVAYLSEHFNVSKTSIIYRLKEYELISEESRTKSIKQIIEGFNFEQFI
ncbi:ImmA/IrrE family metallo-endopeptidase [Tenacibaculum finnmarkense]|uniref:ImmA/IrrE family metallo-endopeptidase n=1 Tax=Tenacibaculum finnmarkense genomovar finnmarkense TaxID=1458503 RepID=A0AAP1RHT7_9FLAO|nr:ImmA/IrrE family metallo-endopeptidase [Tenacibaculum finnmarkense]MBE7653973.1 ImmA/IrrE family metallo-endopeptidase [Tenacibaculum finnmarkense genomovar finnmarkense]MBE7696274.1 ImmA/IrrE family metallo-endopeptidase [Tenacibaculum finnmarkense genomovar finnmarkense]MCD8428509.1 ImmA/IrrE family metallo-endopeptidase [Tenacibaculum finnmarkense genomovar finnmarkense]MCD8440863.1 ImmA/IrrE family metallo-endopeptidase [Tenacibaculum finnmarkense genomovar ulcerans]MCD8455257.1 ImmA/Ir